MKFGATPAPRTPNEKPVGPQSRQWLVTVRTPHMFLGFFFALPTRFFAMKYIWGGTRLLHRFLISIGSSYLAGPGTSFLAGESEGLFNVEARLAGVHQKLVKIKVVERNRQVRPRKLLRFIIRQPQRLLVCLIYDFRYEPSRFAPPSMPFSQSLGSEPRAVAK